MNYNNEDWPRPARGIAIKAWLVAGMMFLLAMLPAPSRGADGGAGSWDIILGGRAGYALFLGPYRDDFRNSYRVGAYIALGNTGIVRFLMGEADFDYGRHAMRESGKSYLQFFSGSIGPLLVFPAARYFQPFAGASLRGSYVHLHAERTRRNVKSFKPGLLARTGFYVPIRRGFRLRFGADYTLEYLSGKPLHGLAFTGGVAYNFGGKQGDWHEGDDESIRVDRLMAQGRSAMNDGRVEDAKARFRAVLDMRPGNPEAAEALAEISEVPALERRGIDLYEQGDYRGCIVTMKRLLLIDPDNKAGLLYLPRAQRRQEALERLR
jgi:tetratricopeptide (TPR) repeat protein